MSSQPPKHFHVETESKASSNNNSHQHQLCKLCLVGRRKLVCRNCMNNGNWINSNHNDSERFIDKKLKLKNLKNAQLNQQIKFQKTYEKFIKLEDLRTSLLKSRKRNANLEQLIKEKKESIQKLNEVKKEISQRNRAQRIILPKYEDKVNKLGDYVLEAVEKNDYLKKQSLEQMEELKQMRRSYIDTLLSYIFPMSQKISKCSVVQGHSRKASNESLKPETISEIAEAMLMTTHAKSDFMQQGSLGDLMAKEFIIVAPSLNSDGNYQSYCEWIHSNKDGSLNSGMVAAAGTSDSGQVENNHAYRIAAALCFIAQFVQALMWVLDVRLPHKVSYPDFCTMGLNEQQFRKKVARLNLNIVYLCYTQNMSMKNLQPARTMENLFQLLDIRNVDLGRTGPVLDISQRSVDSIMQSFTEIFDDEHSDSDEDDSDDTTLQKDWENIGNLPILEISQSAMLPQQSSMAGTIMNVAQSFWKWK